MRRSAVLLLAASALLCVAAEEAKTEHVVTLNGSEDFEAAVKKSTFLVGEFYAPWCGHCKTLAPEYEKAAKQLKEEGAEVVLAKVDATLDENKDLAAKYGVRGFPTLKVFKNGDAENPTDYNGPRDAPGIVAHITKLTGPASKELTTAAEVTEYAKGDIAVLGVFAAKDSPEFAAFEATADKLREDFSFAHTFDAKLAPQVKASPGVVVLKTFDEPSTAFKGDFTSEALSAFVDEATTPDLVEMDQTPRNKRSLNRIFADSEKPKLLAIVPKGAKGLDKIRAELTKASKDRAADLSVLFVDAEASPQVGKFFALEDADLPAFAIHEQTANIKYIAKSVMAGSLASWLDKHKAGKLEKHIKSEEPPAKNDGPVKVVTAKTFEKLVTKSGKNVLVEFYAPWCGHCKSLEPIFVKVGEHFAKDDTVTIAKFDATANDIPDSKFAVQGFPTLYWLGADGALEQYSGARGLEDLTTYVEAKLSGKEAEVESPVEEEEETGHEEL